MPELYNQHYINKYSFPKGLTACRKQQVEKKPRQSIYDMYAQPVRRGVSGWKLTKRIVQQDEKLMPKQPRRRGNTIGHGENSIDQMGSNSLQPLNDQSRFLQQMYDSNLNMISNNNSQDYLQYGQIKPSPQDYMTSTSPGETSQELPQNMMLDNSGGMLGVHQYHMAQMQPQPNSGQMVGLNRPIDDLTNSEDRGRESHMKSTLQNNSHQLYHQVRQDVNSAEVMMQMQPGSGPAGQGKTNKVLLHSLNELSIGTANMKGGDLQTEAASIQGP